MPTQVEDLIQFPGLFWEGDDNYRGPRLPILLNYLQIQLGNKDLLISDLYMIASMTELIVCISILFTKKI